MINLKNFSTIQSNRDYYKVIKHLGSGGNGTAYLVLCTSGIYIGQYFSLKIFYNISKPDRLKRFMKEIEFLKHNNHPSLVRHYDEGIYKDKYGNEFPFVVTSYLKNTLEDELKKGRIELGRALFYTTQLLSAVNCLQEENIIHRDIKPGNIFIDGTNILLGDFGLIKEIKQGEYDNEIKNDKDMVKNYICKECYSDAPALPKGYRTPDIVEYIKGNKNLTLKSDIFQVGLVIAEIFTGKNILKRCNNIYDKIELDSLGKIPGEILSGRISKLIFNMTEINPENRKNISSLLNDFISISEQYWKKKEKLDGLINL